MARSPDKASDHGEEVMPGEGMIGCPPRAGNSELFVLQRKSLPVSRPWKTLYFGSSGGAGGGRGP